MNFFSLFAFGVLVGIVGGLLGLGGGVLLVPGLMLLFGLSQQESQGTSLAVLTPPIGIFAALVYYQNGFVKLPVVTAIALGFMLGAYLGARLVPAIPVAGLRFGFGAMMLFLGFQFVFSPGDGKSAVALPAGVATAITALLGWASRRFYRASPEQRESESARDDYHI